MKTTVVIPAMHEIYLNQTIREVYAKAAGEIEVFVGMDGTWELPLPEDRPGLTIIHWPAQRGHRAIMNAAACLGTGDYLMKLDAHCALSDGFDAALAAECDVDWVVVPRRYSLNVERWDRAEKTPVDYEYIRYPYQAGAYIGTTAKYYWTERQRARAGIEVDENMICQGSCMFLRMDYFRRRMHPMDEVSYGHYLGEQFEICLKAWLSGGRLMTNKRAWYAHLWKGNGYRQAYQQARGNALPLREDPAIRAAGMDHQTRYWLGDQWGGRIHNFDWLLDRFWPVPGWPKNRELWTLCN